MTASTARPSPILLRLSAALVDFTIIVVIVLPLQLVWTTTADRSTPTTGSNWLALAIIAGYPIVSVAHWNRTAGKWLCSLRVQRTDGRPTGWVLSIVRFLVWFSPFASGLAISSVPEGGWRTLAGVGQIALMFAVYTPVVLRKDRRGLHDLLAGTAVVTLLPSLVPEGAAEELRRR